MNILFSLLSKSIYRSIYLSTSIYIYIYIFVSRDNRKSTESSNSEDGESNPLNLKSNMRRQPNGKHFNAKKKKL